VSVLAAPAGSKVIGLDGLLEEIALVLPAQGPLNVFVHHNTLHAFEHLPFEKAVVEAAELYGTEPYMTEAAFAEHLESGRILQSDLDAVLGLEFADGDEPIFDGGPKRSAFRLARLRHLFEVPRDAALSWTLIEGGGRTTFHGKVDAGRRAAILRSAERVHGPLGDAELTRRTLERLWDDLERVAPSLPAEAVGVRRRDQLLAVDDIDVDRFVHPVLIRLCAAFLDQGVAYWSMPGREHGFLISVRRLYGQRLASPNPWFLGMARELRRQEKEGWDAARTIEWALGELEVAPGDRAEFLRRTALALRGWAGMMSRFETRPDQAPVEPWPARLADFLAVRLVFDVFAAKRALRLVGRTAGGFRGLDALQANSGGGVDLERVFQAFVMAQVKNVNLRAFHDEAKAQAWMAEVTALDGIERRRLLHLAYERRHRTGVLDGLVAHCRMPIPEITEPRFQAVFCIDDRECSTRRHLEESCASVETFGYAGFFGVAMAYKGLDDIRAKPLCPVNLVPRHFVAERALRPEEETAYHAARRRHGSVAYSLSVGSKTLSRGGVLAPLLGMAFIFPLIARCLAPRLAERLAHRFAGGPKASPPTRLALLRHSEELDEDGRKAGYSFEEMADVVEAMLRTIALDQWMSRLVLIVGHGSSSLNNPHEAAHDCGATGGGRGGPNARAFAAMANRDEVRELLAKRGLPIPNSTWFVGSYHNTCDDAMHYFDLDLVPDTFAEELKNAQDSLHDACCLEAHERCRRFQSNTADLQVDQAVARAQAHSMDLAQPRPEYGHATNAVAIVGRRSRTRGLFLDRRAFLVSYDLTPDPDGALLEKLLAAVIPVGAGINLEYYFSFVDPLGYGSGTKLPHNITGLIGVMDGHASDLRTGLPWQMVEIHEPVRLLTIVEAKRETLERILKANPDTAAFLANGWVQLARWEPGTDQFEVFTPNGFVEYVPENPHIPVVENSAEYYAGHSQHLGAARANAGLSSDSSTSQRAGARAGGAA
jgi:uncharacterized protein YbcC (UPF0753/DUF2309 family)